jgi:hypothetical protein
VSYIRLQARKTGIEHIRHSAEFKSVKEMPQLPFGTMQIEVMPKTGLKPGFDARLKGIDLPGMKIERGRLFLQSIDPRNASPDQFSR